MLKKLKAIKKQTFGILFLFLPIFAFGQGDNYVLFSKTGDTLITRASCYCKSKDTLSSYFHILDNIGGKLRLISYFEIREPNKNSIPCADFSLVHQDTIAKYGLYNFGKLGITPKKFRIKSKIIRTDTATTDKRKLVYYRQIRHKFKIGYRTFYTATMWNISENKRNKIDPPRVSEIFGSKELKKYYFVITIKNDYIDRETGKIRTVIEPYTRIIN